MSKNNILLSSIFLFVVSCNILGLFEKPISDTKKIEIEETATQSTPVYRQFFCLPNKKDFETAFFVDVIDGDSIRVRVDGRETEVRYIGINTPEYHSADQAQAIRATDENLKLIKDKKLYMFKDLSNTDKYGRLLRYVFTDTYFVNYELVRRKFAEPKAYPPDTACQNLFIKASYEN